MKKHEKNYLLKGVILLTLIFVCMFTASVYATNSGTETDPYLVSNVDDLQGYFNLGGHIKLNANIEAGEFTGDKFVIPKDATVELDFNGYTLSGYNDNPEVSANLIKNNGDLTIKDSSSNVNGKITMGGNGKRLNNNKFGIHAITNCGILTVNSGTIENTGKTDVPYAIDNNSTSSNVLLTINGGNIISNRGAAIRAFANSEKFNNDIIVNDGNITCVTSAIWLQQANTKANKATLTVNGGNITGNGYNAIFASVYNDKDTSKAFEITINGGIITNNHETKATVSFEEFGGGELDKAIINLNITGGIFTNINEEGRALFNPKYASLTNDGIKITGGVYATDVSEYIKEGYIAGKQENGTYLVKQIVDMLDINILGISDKTYTGKELKQDISVKYNDVELKEGTDYIVSYEDNTNMGTAKIIITGKVFYKGTVTKEFKIVPISIEEAIVTGILDKIYTGKELIQDISVKYNELELKEGTDYIVSYEDNTNIGTAKIIITGKGYYKGTVTKEFKINPISIKDIKVTGLQNRTYNGKGLTQDIIVTLNGKALKKDFDYKVSYLNNTNPGEATVVVSGIGIYGGEITKSFLITPKKLTGLKVSSQTTSKVNLSWTKHDGVTGYKVYSYNYSKEKWEYVGKTSGTSYTIEKLNAGTTYKYRVRAYKTIDGTQYFGSYTSSLKTATKPKMPSVKIKAGDEKVTFTWNKVSGATGYKIYMSTSKNGKYTRIKTITNNKTIKYTKSGLKANKKYYFKVRAYRQVDDEQIYSSYTKVLSATTKKVHTVKRGETLYRLAEKYKTTVNKLRKINNLKKSSIIKIGFRLLLN